MNLFVIKTPTPNGNSYFAAKTESNEPPVDNLVGWWVWSKYDAEQLARIHGLNLICEYPEWNPMRTINHLNRAKV